MTASFAIAIKLFIVMAILLFMSQIANFTVPDIETYPSTNDASLITAIKDRTQL
jgi:hypothetical protein